MPMKSLAVVNNHRYPKRALSYAINSSDSISFQNDHTMTVDYLIKGGVVFDGSGADRVIRDIAIHDGRVADIAPQIDVYDARGQWVMPGFIDFHTHYDAEVEIDAGLSESVRHGVTTVVMGSCSLSTAVGEPEDIADIFCRVEGVPRSTMLPLLETQKTWQTFPEYLDHLSQLNLGPNVAAFVGHSNLRMHVMGFERSLDPKARPTPGEMASMQAHLTDALNAGYLGLSIQTLPWDKLDGERFRSRPLPSYFARWSEYRQLTKLLRARDRVFQGVPNITTKINVLLFLWESVGLFRRPLKTTVISLMDIIANRWIYRIVPLAASIAVSEQTFGFAPLNPFDVWADGMDLVIFEESTAAAEYLRVADLGQRAGLLRCPKYRQRFRRNWKAFILPKGLSS